MCDSLSRAFVDIAVPSEEPDATKRRAAAAALLLDTLQEIVERSRLKGYAQSLKEEAIQQVLLKLLQRPQREQRYADAQVRSFLRRGLKWALVDLSNAERYPLREEPRDDEQAAPELPSQSIAAAEPGIKLDLERLARYLEHLAEAQRMTPGRVQALDDLLARASHGWAWEELAAAVCPRCQLGRLQRAQGAQDGVCARCGARACLEPDSESIRKQSAALRAAASRASRQLLELIEADCEEGRLDEQSAKWFSSFFHQTA